jgi:hypothetical protein
MSESIVDEETVGLIELLYYMYMYMYVYDQVKVE